jgi:CHAT domain-containing protein
MPPQLQAELQQNNIRHLVFALDRFLRYIPMAALYDGEQYLIETYTIATVTAAGSQNPNNPLPTTQQISVLGLGLSEPVPADPSKGIPHPFSQLANVPAELAAIVQQNDSTNNTRGSQGIFNGRGLLNQDFDRAALRTATQHQILHIATHGSFDPISANNAFIVLGTKEALTIADIQNFGTAFFGNLSLVVLSACETALGEAERYREGVIPDGKEVTSIAHTFINAGADTIIASLWQVNDPATATLMRQFYTNLAANRSEAPVIVSQALQKAQLSLLHGQTVDGTLATRSNANPASITVEPTGSAAATRYAHPYYWSAFTIIGDGL